MPTHHELTSLTAVFYSMQIQLKRINPNQHTLTVRHPDGKITEETLETKSFLMHDLVHLALEETANLRDSFWGTLAQQKDPNRENLMGRKDFKPEKEIEFTEVLTGPLMGLTRKQNAIDTTLTIIQEMFRSYQVETPTYVNRQFLMTFLTRFNQLEGMWHSTPFGMNMEIIWQT